MLKLETLALNESVNSNNRFYIYQGSDTPLYITVNKLTSDGVSLAQYDLTGCTVWFTLKRYLNDTDNAAIVQKVSTSDSIIIDAEMGLVKIPLASTDTAALPQWYCDYFFDVQVKDAANKILTSGNGTIGIYPTITRTKA